MPAARRDANVPEGQNTGGRGSFADLGEFAPVEEGQALKSTRGTKSELQPQIKAAMANPGTPFGHPTRTYTKEEVISRRTELRRAAGQLGLPENGYSLRFVTDPNVDKAPDGANGIKFQYKVVQKASA